MSWTVNEIMKTHQSTEPIKTVTQEQYQQWAREFTFDGLKDLRYGQSFCNYFGITDNILFYSRTPTEADRYIQKVYVK
jgi:hypothetical protein